MKCSRCHSDVPENAKFCPECGGPVQLTEGCSQCGVTLKPDARFCYNCGAQVGNLASSTANRPNEPERTARNWLSSVGPFLFIPIFAAIIVILFWKNRDPEPVTSPANAATSQSGGMDMGGMQMVHDTLDRLKRRLESDPTDVEAIDSLATMYSIAGSHAKAAEFYEKHLELEPDNTQIKIALGWSYHNSQRSQEGIAKIEEVLSIEPHHAVGLFYIAEIKAAIGEVDDATAHWKTIVDHYPDTEIGNMAQQRIHQYTHSD